MTYYYVDVHVGLMNEPRKQSLIVDTASSITAFACKEFCQSCKPHYDPPYSLKESSLYQPVDWDERKCTHCQGTSPSHCMFHKTYKEGVTYDGFYVRDKIIFGEGNDDNNTMPIIFGCVSLYSKYL